MTKNSVIDYKFSPRVISSMGKAWEQAVDKQMELYACQRGAQPGMEYTIEWKPARDPGYLERVIEWES